MFFHVLFFLNHEDAKTPRHTNFLCGTLRLKALVVQTVKGFMVSISSLLLARLILVS
jgi:hypothetical protein